VLLAIDTATRGIGLAIYDGSALLAEHLWISRGYHTVQLAPEIALMLRRLHRSIEDVEAIGLAIGPGSFTGLRIGMALAKGLAIAHPLRLIGVPTFDILAYGQPERSDPLLALIEMGRKRVAGVWYKWGRVGWEAQSDPETLDWVEVVERIEGQTYVCGEISPVGRSVLGDDPRVVLGSPALCARRPGHLAEIAYRRMRRGDVDQPETLAPLYLRTQSGL